MAKNISSIALASVLISSSMLSLVGCVTTSTPQYVIDSDSYQATGKSERIKTIVLHYTVSDNERSIKTLTTGNVSAHYLVLDNDDNRIYNLVPESERAWHAGDGGFAGRTILNDTSIGIEIVNSGIKPEYRDALKKMARSTITLMSTMWHLMSCRLKKSRTTGARYHHAL